MLPGLQVARKRENAYGYIDGATGECLMLEHFPAIGELFIWAYQGSDCIGLLRDCARDAKKFGLKYVGFITAEDAELSRVLSRWIGRKNAPFNAMFVPNPENPKETRVRILAESLL